MQRKCQVIRDGEVIGKHDEPTMLALLNAGALRLSDQYWRPGMDQPVSLADYLCHGGQRVWIHRPLFWLMLSIPLALVIVGLVSATHHKVVPLAAMATARPLPLIEDPEQPEIRRAIPIIRGRFEASARDDGISFPQHTVEQLATHSRVAVLAFDDQGLPLGLGSGVVVADGRQVLTATEAVAGASRIEVHLANGTIVEATTARVDDELVALALPSAAVAIPWADEPITTGAAIGICNHPLGESPGSAVQLVQTIIAGAQRVHYALDSAFAPSTAGSGVLNRAGGLVGLLVDPANGRVLRAADALKFLEDSKPGPISQLATRRHASVQWPLTVSDAVITDGKAIVTLRNQCGETLHRVVLHLRSYQSPTEAVEVRKLEEQLRYSAVQSGESSNENTPEALVVRQALRDVTTRLESAHQRLRAALALARTKPVRSEIQVIECDLAPGSVQRIILEVNAASNWGIDATVLEAVL